MSNSSPNLATNTGNVGNVGNLGNIGMVNNVPMNSNIIDIMLMKFFMQDSKTDFTIWSIISILVIQNIHEIKKVITEIFVWVREQLLKWLKEQFLFFWELFRDRYFPDPKKIAAQEQERKNLEIDMLIMRQLSENTDTNYNGIDNTINNDSVDNLVDSVDSNVVDNLTDKEENSDKKVDKEPDKEPDKEEEIIKTEEVLALTMTKSKGYAKTQTDILAFINYLIHRNLYLRYIVDIHRETGDKYSSLETHDLQNPIIVDIDDDLKFTLNEHLSTKVEVSIHDAKTIKVQEVYLVDRDNSSDSSSSSSKNSNNSNNRSNRGNDSSYYDNGSDNNNSIHSGHNSGSSSSSSSSSGSSGKVANMVKPYEVNFSNVSESSILVQNFMRWGKEKFGPHKIWEQGIDSHKLSGSWDGFLQLDSKKHFNDFFNTYYQPIPRSIFGILFFSLLVSKNIKDMTKLLLLPTRETVLDFCGWKFRFSSPFPAFTKQRLNTIREFVAYEIQRVMACSTYVLHGYYSDPCDIFLKYIHVNSLGDDRNVREYFHSIGDCVNLTNSENTSNTSNASNNASNSANAANVSNVPVKKERNKKYSMEFSSNTLNRDQLYTRAEEFLNTIRLDYFKHIKMPKAFKEIKIFTIKLKYKEVSETNPNPAYITWEKNRQEEIDLYEKCKNKWDSGLKKAKDLDQEEKKKLLSKYTVEKKTRDRERERVRDRERERDGRESILTISQGQKKEQFRNNCEDDSSNNSDSDKSDNDDDGTSNNKKKSKSQSKSKDGSIYAKEDRGTDREEGTDKGTDRGTDKETDKGTETENEERKEAQIKESIDNYSVNADKYLTENVYPILPDEIKPPVKDLIIIKKIPELEVKQVGQTYKPIEYLYMRKRAKKQLQAILNNFTSNSEIYQKMGILHKMCLMIHGQPGTGKTTAIRAIASHLQRDIYYLDLNGILANSHLQMIFNYLVTNCGGRGVVVMEDIDCMTPIVLSREIKAIVEQQDIIRLEKAKQKLKRKERIRLASMGVKDLDDSSDEDENESSVMVKAGMAGGIENGIAESKNSEELTLSYLLNLLDGTISIEDLVVIITTNHPEKLDKALYRPGRMDAQLEFNNCNAEMISTIFETMFERKLSQETTNKLVNDKFTPAEVIFHFLPKIYQVDETDDDICAPFLEGSMIPLHCTSF